jgi:acetoin utilization deacetylase AcuC-like enzyme
MHMIFYSPDYNASEHDFDTVRKADLVASKIRQNFDGFVEFATPTSATAEQLTAVHSPNYIGAVATGAPKSLAESQGFPWDQQLFKAAASSTGGVVDAAIHALRTGDHAGSLSSGLHHARFESGAGFCTFNGLALAASELSRQWARTLILDFDAHCGGGTAELIGGSLLGSVYQIDVSVVPFDYYKDTPNAELHMAGADDYLDVIKRVLTDARIGEFDAVLYNAGMDPHEQAGGIRGIDTDMLAERERMVWEFLDSNAIPTTFVLAGGYEGLDFTLEDVADLHMLTVDEYVLTGFSHEEMAS